jgi:SsrA-binding protein
LAVERGSEEIRVVVRNRRATHLFEIVERIEAGLALVGSEVKSVRAGKVTLSDAYAAPKGRELFLFHMHIAAYEKASIDPHDPLRPRKLLLHRRQIERLIGKVSERGLTLVPLLVYFRDGIVKVELGMARGKHKFDKRQAIAERDSKRELARVHARQDRE